jgi:hypothetical protein
MPLYSQEPTQSGQSLEHHHSGDFQAKNYTRHFLAPRQLAPERLSGRLEGKGSSPQLGKSWEISCCTFEERQSHPLATIKTPAMAPMYPSDFGKLVVLLVEEWAATEQARRF